MHSVEVCHLGHNFSLCLRQYAHMSFAEHLHPDAHYSENTFAQAKNLNLIGWLLHVFCEPNVLQSLMVCQAAKAVFSSSGTAAISASEEQLNTELEKKKKTFKCFVWDTCVSQMCSPVYRYRKSIQLAWPNLWIPEWFNCISVVFSHIYNGRSGEVPHFKGIICGR